MTRSTTWALTAPFINAVARVSQTSRFRKRLLIALLDGVLCVLAIWFAYFLRLGEWRFFTEDVIRLAFGALSFWYASALLHGVYKEVFRYAGMGTLVTIAAAIGTMLIPMIIVYLIVLVPGVPRTLSFLQPIVFFILIAASRFTLRELVFGAQGQQLIADKSSRRILIYGAGDAGQRLAGSIRNEPGLYVVGYVDDDKTKAGHWLDRKPIYHSPNLVSLISKESITDVYIAIPRLTRTAKSRIIKGLEQHPVHVMTLPNMREIIEGKVSVNQLREVEVSDLLGRAPVKPDPELLSRTITDKIVMVTGAGGSIGSELCRQILRLQPRKLVLVELSEFALYAVNEEICSQIRSLDTHLDLVPELCNVADGGSIHRVIDRHGPHTIFHAAAYKHVPLVEGNVIGGTRNNVLGTLNTVKAAVGAGVENFILISTDKAVRPTNIMGATKRICEQILQAFASNEEARGNTVFSMVRFGNVLGSSGSVVPLFKRQIYEGGPITLTDKRITRYFMTIAEAAELVIQAGAMSRGGEVFVLDMGASVKIIDLARTMVRLSGLRVKEGDEDGDIEIVEVGLRPGEKLYEELLIGADQETTLHRRIMRAREGHIGYAELTIELGKLRSLIDQGDAHGVREKISFLVPEYKPQLPSN